MQPKSVYNMSFQVSIISYLHIYFLNNYSLVSLFDKAVTRGLSQIIDVLVCFTIVNILISLYILKHPTIS